MWQQYSEILRIAIMISTSRGHNIKNNMILKFKYIIACLSSVINQSSSYLIVVIVSCSACCLLCLASSIWLAAPYILLLCLAYCLAFSLYTSYRYHGKGG